MRAWRLCRAAFADLGGEGALLYGGRWNCPGRPLVYLALSPALAVLEVRVTLDLPPALLPEDYVLTMIDLHDMRAEELPDLPADPQSFGDAWLREARTPVLRVPSFIVPQSHYFLLNPAQPTPLAAGIVETRAFAFDRRLWRPFGGAAGGTT